MEYQNKRTNVYDIVSGKTWKCFAESMNVRVKGYFYILWKSWKQLDGENIFDKEFRLRESSEVMQKCWGKNLFVVKVYLIDEEGGTRTSWDLKSPLE